MISKLLKLNALGLHAVLGTHCEQVLAKSEKVKCRRRLFHSGWHIVLCTNKSRKQYRVTDFIYLGATEKIRQRY